MRSHVFRSVLAIAAFLAVAAPAAAQERTGWENIPPGEMAFVCRAELSEQRPVLDGRPNVVFRLPLASEAIRVPPLLRQYPAASSPRTDADREASIRWNEARNAFVEPRKARFTELLLKSRPHENNKARIDCEITTKEQAYRWGSSTYSAIPPTAIGAEFRDIDNKPSTRPVWGKVYHEDFLPPDWTKGLPGAEIETKAATSGPKPAPKPPPKSSTQTASLTVKTDTSAKDAAKAWDEQVKKTLAAEAQKKVETAARAAQADAKQKAQVEAFFAERRKQGRAQ